jgi:hypothetical protein
LAEFVAKQSGLEYNSSAQEIYLYHGTNCYRRWEIKRTGFIEPGRGNHSYFCTRKADAYMHARAACLKDASLGAVNSLTCEPVVLKVKFNARTWLQVDFVKDMVVQDKEAAAIGARRGFSLAVLGPIAAKAIVDILYCTHGRRLGLSPESMRTFADGTFLAGIYQLRDKLMKKRADMWMLSRLGNFSQSMGTSLAGGAVPELSSKDNLRRLRQVQVRV